VQALKEQLGADAFDAARARGADLAEMDVVRFAGDEIGRAIRALPPPGAGLISQSGLSDEKTLADGTDS